MEISDLFEARQAPLYHFASVERIDELLKTDALVARWTHEIDGKNVVGTSLSRNPKLNWSNSIIRLTFNQDALSRRFKIIPLDGERTFRHTRGIKPTNSTSDRVMNNTKYDQPLAEEFLVGNVPQVHRYLDEIYMMPSADGLSLSYAIELRDRLTAYAKQHDLLFWVSRAVQFD